MRQPSCLFKFASFRTSQRWLLVADVIGCAAAFSLPWTTSGFTILVSLLVIIIIANADFRALYNKMLLPASFIPVALFCLAILGLWWSNQSGSHGLGPVLKLLAFPVLFYHFGRSRHPAWIFYAFLISCIFLMVHSWVIVWHPTWAFKTGRCCGEDYGVPVRNYIDQSQEFVLCMTGLTAAAIYFWQGRSRSLAVTSLFCASAFAANLLFVVTSRTALVCIPLMFACLTFKHFGARGMILALLLTTAIFSLALTMSPNLRTRVESASSQFLEYREANAPTSVGKRLEFWRKSLGFFRDAPLIGHGTGSTQALFEQSAVSQSGVSAEVISNPHNQVLNVAVQWGFVGIMLLIIMWFAHLRLFFALTLASDIGLLVVVENIVGSVFNSHIFDFTEGWLYVLGTTTAAGFVVGRATVSYVGGAANGAITPT